MLSLSPCPEKAKIMTLSDLAACASESFHSWLLCISLAILYISRAPHVAGISLPLRSCWHAIAHNYSANAYVTKNYLIFQVPNRQI